MNDLFKVITNQLSLIYFCTLTRILQNLPFIHLLIYYLHHLKVDLLVLYPSA